MQKDSFAVEAGSKADERAIGSNNAVAGDDNRDGIATHGTAHSLRRATSETVS